MPKRRDKADTHREFIIDIPVDPADWNIPVRGPDGRFHYADTRATAERDEDESKVTPEEPHRDVHMLPGDATPEEISALVRAIKGGGTDGGE